MHTKQVTGIQTCQLGYLVTQSVEHEIHIEMKAQIGHILSLSKKMMISILSAYNFLTKNLTETCLK